jgi:ATP-binding cassette subfamily B protein
MIDQSLAKGFADAVVPIVVFAALLLMQLFLGAYLTLSTGKLKETMSYTLHKQFIERLYKTEWSSLHKYHNGDIQTRLTSDVNNVVELWTSTVPMMISLFVQLVMAFATLWFYDPTLAMFAFILGPISIVISWFIGRKLKSMQHQIQGAESRYRSFLLESVHNILIVKSFEHEQHNLNQMGQYQQSKLGWVLKRNMFTVKTALVMGLGYRLGFFLSFVMGAFKLSAGTTTFGTFTAFLQLVGQIQGPIEGLSRSLPLIMTTFASAERLMEFETLHTEANKTSKVEASNEKITSLSFENISFSYEENKPILSDISLNIKAGEIIAVVGTTGEGKTTLLRLLLALLKPGEGELFVTDSHNHKRIVSSDTRSYFSYVPQGNTLFSGTIADNIRVGRPSATDNELIYTAQQACAWDFIQKLPQGLETIIGANGQGLSEGQCQRIAIARALLRQSPILLLDEATSALDLNTEWAVLQRIKETSPQRTCIAITHRLSVIDICDRVYELSEGRLVEMKKSEQK